MNESMNYGNYGNAGNNYGNAGNNYGNAGGNVQPQGQYPPYDPSYGLREDYRVIGRKLGSTISLVSLVHHEEIYEAGGKKYPYRVFDVIGSKRGLSLSSLTRYTTFGESEDWKWLNGTAQPCLILSGESAEQNYIQLMEYLASHNGQLTVVGRGTDRFQRLYYAFA